MDKIIKKLTEADYKTFTYKVQDLCDCYDYLSDCYNRMLAFGVEDGIVEAGTRFEDTMVSTFKYSEDKHELHMAYYVDDTKLIGLDWSDILNDYVKLILMRDSWVKDNIKKIFVYFTHKSNTIVELEYNVIEDTLGLNVTCWLMTAIEDLYLSERFDTVTFDTLKGMVLGYLNIIVDGFGKHKSIREYDKIGTIHWDKKKWVEIKEVPDWYVDGYNNYKELHYSNSNSVLLTKSKYIEELTLTIEMGFRLSCIQEYLDYSLYLGKVIIQMLNINTNQKFREDLDKLIGIVYEKSEVVTFEVNVGGRLVTVNFKDYADYVKNSDSKMYVNMIKVDYDVEM